MSNNQDLKFSFRGNKEVNIPIIFGLIGFLISIIVLTDTFYKTRHFQEIELSNKSEIITAALKKREAQLITLKMELETKAEDYKAAKNNELHTLTAKSILKINELLAKTKTDISYIAYSSPDSLFDFYGKYIYIKRDSILKVFNQDSLRVKELNAALIDRYSESENPIVHNTILKFKQGSSPTRVAFFSKYPLFAYWFLLAIAQMIFWLMVIPILIGIASSTDEIVPSMKFWSLKTLIFFPLPIFVMVIFIYCFNEIIDAYVIKDTYFFSGFTSAMEFFGIVGYTIAIFTFGIYLFLANKLKLLSEQSKGVTLADDEKLKTQYSKLKTGFNRAFLCSALILSVFVFWEGLLFNAINGMEGFRFYRLISNKPFLSNDFVLLVGLIHSLILLVFYIPVHFQFKNLEISQQAKAESNPSAWKTIYETISVVLVTGSPVISSYLQKILEILMRDN